MSYKLTSKQVQKLHKLYIEKHKSLSKTAKYANSHFGTNLNRHQLSALFKRGRLTVLPPNGRSENWRMANPYPSPESQLAFNIIDSAAKDFRSFMKTGKGKIYYLNAGAFFASQMYINLVDFLSSHVHTDRKPFLPTEIKVEDVRYASSLYDDQYRYWVLV